MAEAFAAEYHAVPGVVFTSAGTTTPGGWAVAGLTIRAMASVGIDVSGHVSRSLEEVIADNPDRVYVMTQLQQRSVATAFPGHRDRVVMLDPAGVDIEDPYGEEIATYSRVRSIIESAVAARAVQWSS